MWNPVPPNVAGKISHTESARSGGVSSCEQHLVSSIYLSLKVTVTGSFHCANDCFWFLRHQTTLETYLGFVPCNNLPLTVLRMMAAASLFPFSFHRFLVESTYNSAIFCTSSLLWATEQKPLSVCLSVSVRSMHELSLRDTLFVFFLAIAIFPPPPKQDSVSSYLSGYCGFYPVVQLRPSANALLRGLTGTRLATQLLRPIALGSYRTRTCV